MPSGTEELHQVHVNPAHRANTQSSADDSSMRPSPPLVSRSPSHPFSTVTTPAVAGPSSSTTTPSQIPAHHQSSKRARKRKRDHSVIEKARRKKINEALAELKGLVPATWGREGSGPAGDAKDEGRDDNDEEGGDEGEDGEEDDAEDEDPRSTTKSPKRQLRKQTAKAKTGKGGGKEREFKLDILERTVGYIKEVIGKVKELEVEVEALRADNATTGAITKATRDDRDGCSRCTSKEILEGRKRGRDSFPEQEDLQRKERPSKRFQPIPSPSRLPASTSSRADIESPTVSAQSRSRLPSISSWLPSALATSASLSDSAANSSLPHNPFAFNFNHLQSRSGSTSTSPQNPAYSRLYPPSSLQFDPSHGHGHPSAAVLPRLNSSQRGTNKDSGPAATGTSSMSKGAPG